MGEGLRAPNDPPPPSPHATAMRSQMFSKIGVLKNFAIFTRNIYVGREDSNTDVFL